MTKVFAVFQEEMAGNELQGVVANPEAALVWVQKLQRIYQMTHFDPIEAVEEDGGVRRWVALYASWEVRELPILQEAPILSPSPLVLLALRLRDHVDPKATVEDLPDFLQEIVRAEREAIGSENLAFGKDEDVGWFVLHLGPDLVYVVDVERELDVEGP